LVVAACSDSQGDHTATKLDLETEDASVSGSRADDGAGGSAADGGAADAAVGGGAAPIADPGDVGNSFVSGAWHGYFWASAQGAGSSISPANFMGQTTGMPRCVKGSVAATKDYSGIAMLGVHLNEDGEGKRTVTPTKEGIRVGIDNKAGSVLRFQLEGPSGSGVARWCTYLQGQGGFVPWASLNTACWDKSGKAYDNEPILSAAVIVPGTTTEAVAFDFCLTSLAEADGE
jgi:hypothetical protein